MPKNRILKKIMWTNFHQQSSKRWNLNGSLSSAAQCVTGKLPPNAYLERLMFVTNHKQTISDFHQCSISRVHEEQIVMKARVKKRHILRVQVTVNVMQACNCSHYITLYPACRFNASCTSIGQNWILFLGFLLSAEASWRIHIVLMHCF